MRTVTFVACGSFTSACQLSFHLFMILYGWLSVPYLSLTPGPQGSQSLYWLLESTPPKSLHWSRSLSVTLPLRRITGLHTGPARPEMLICQVLSCPGLTYYIPSCNHKCGLKIGVFAYLYVWLRYHAAASTCVYSGLRGLVLLFVSQKSLPCRFFWEMSVCSRLTFWVLSFLFPVLTPCCDVALLERQWCQIGRPTGRRQGFEGSCFPGNKSHVRKTTLFIHYSCLFSSGLNNTEVLNAKYISDSESFLVDGIIPNWHHLKNFENLASVQYTFIC